MPGNQVSAVELESRHTSILWNYAYHMFFQRTGILYNIQNGFGNLLVNNCFTTFFQVSDKPTILSILKFFLFWSIMYKMFLLTLCTFIDGNMFWNIVAMSFTWFPSPLKLFITNNGWCRYWTCSTFGFRNEEITSLRRQYSWTLKVSVGPRGKRQSLKYTPISVFANITKWETWSKPATLTKSFNTFFFLTCWKQMYGLF